MNAKSLAAALGFIGIVLPGTLTLIFKNGCAQDNRTSPGRHRTNAPSKVQRPGEGESRNPSTDISTNLLQATALPRKNQANEIP